MSNPLRELAHQLFDAGKGYKAIARSIEVPRQRVVNWVRRGRWKRHEHPSTQEGEHPRLGHADRPYRGITWQDMPGKNDDIKKLNFSEFRHGKYHLQHKCRGLEGEALKQRMCELTEDRRRNGRLGGDWKNKKQQDT